jgi:hypothetical protein
VVSGDTTCDRCSVRWHEHGWIDAPEDGHVVCPGDWIVTTASGGRQPFPHPSFEATYDRVLDAAEAEAT